MKAVPGSVASYSTHLLLLLLPHYLRLECQWEEMGCTSPASSETLSFQVAMRQRALADHLLLLRRQHCSYLGARYY